VLHSDADGERVVPNRRTEAACVAGGIARVGAGVKGGLGASQVPSADLQVVALRVVFRAVNWAGLRRKDFRMAVKKRLAAAAFGVLALGGIGAGAVDTPEAGDTADAPGAADTDNVQQGGQSGPDQAGPEVPDAPGAPAK